MFDKLHAAELLAKWQGILRLRDWDIRLLMVDQPWRKTGDIKIDQEDKKAILMLNNCNPKEVDCLEEVIVHELLHLKLWGMDQMLEELLLSVFGENEEDPKQQFALTQFMVLLESTVEDLTKGFLSLGGETKDLSFGRIERQVDEELGKKE